MGIMDQISNMMQSANEGAMKALELQTQGYTKVVPKKFEYHTDYSDDELSCISKYKKDAIFSLIPLIFFVAVFGVIIYFALANTSNEAMNSPMAKIMPWALLGAVFIFMVILPLISVIGKKSVCTVKVAGKRVYTTRSSKGQTHIHYCAITYQDSPERVYSDSVPVSKKVFDDLVEGDVVTIVKSPTDCKAYKA